jgi:hypothetical protein
MFKDEGPAISVKKLDHFLTIALLTLFLVSLATFCLLQGSPAGENMTVEIYKSGQLYRVIPLPAPDEDIKIEDPGGHYNLVEIKDGRVRVKEADCPNQICVKTGWLSKPGQISFCAPNKVKVVIKCQSDRVDTITY